MTENLRFNSPFCTKSASLPEGKHLARGESALWAAVITQALMDALHRPTTAEASYAKHEARQWLTGNSRDFHMVCECAGFDPGYVRRMAKRVLAAPRKWRADPGDGKRYVERREHRRRMRLKSCEPCQRLHRIFHDHSPDPVQRLRRSQD